MRRTLRGLLAAFSALSVTFTLLVTVLYSSAPAEAASGHRKILIAGDSITHGSNGDYTWRYRLFKKLQSTAAGNFEFVGPATTMFDHHDDATPSSNYLDPSFSGKKHAAKWGTTFHEQIPLIEGNVRSSNANVLVVLLGINDLTFRGATPEDLIQSLKTYVGNARKANSQLDVVVGQVLTKWNHWGPSEVMVSETSHFKDLLPAAVASLSNSNSKVVVAPTLNGWIPSAHAWDGTHPDPAGETLIAQRMSEGLAAVGLGTVAPNIYNPNQRWSQVAPAPTLTMSPETALMTWNLKPTGSTGMYINYHLDLPDQNWVHLPYPIGTDTNDTSKNNRWTLPNLVGGAMYDFALNASKGTARSDKFGPIVSRAVPGTTPVQPSNLKPPKLRTACTVPTPSYGMSP